MFAVLLYRPLHPVQHFYLLRPLELIGAVAVALPVAWLVATRSLARSIVVLGVLLIVWRAVPAVPGYASVSESLAALGPLLLQFVEGVFELGQRLLRLGQEVDAGPRQRHLARRPREQLQPEVLLKLAHAMTDRGLRQIEMRRCALEAAAFGDADERLQPEKVDAH